MDFTEGYNLIRGSAMARLYGHIDLDPSGTENNGASCGNSCVWDGFPISADPEPDECSTETVISFLISKERRCCHAGGASSSPFGYDYGHIS